MEGGNENAVITFLETGVSPVYESEAPFWINQEEGAYGEIYYTRPTEEEVNARVLDESLADKKYFRLKDSHYTSIQQERDAVKQLIMDYGAVTTSFYNTASKGIVREEGGEFSYYTGFSFSKVGSNHAIAVVGWDDNYPAENFINTPPGNGAWLCKDSAGPDVKDFDGTTSNGYEWISYYEGTLNGATAFEMVAYDENEKVYYEPDGGTRLSPSLFGQNGNPGPVRYITTYTAKAYSDGSAESLTGINQTSNWGHGEATLYLNPIVEDGEVVSYSYKRRLEDRKVDWSDNPIYIPAGTTFGIYHEREACLDDYHLEVAGYDSNGVSILQDITNDVWMAVTEKAQIQCSTSVTLSKESLSLKQGETDTLTASVLPENTTMKGVSYHTTDENIAVVDDTGKVTPTGAGSCEIVAMAWDGKSSDRCLVTVRASSIDLKDTTVGIGHTTELTPVYADGFLGETADKYSWSVSDTALASINDNGVIMGIKKGTVTVSAYLKADPAVKASCSVKIVQPATGITFGLAANQVGISMTEGETKKISASLLPADADKVDIIYTLEGLYGAEPVKYENGVLTAVESGTAVLTATIVGTTISESLDISVYAPVSDISYGSDANVSLKAGETSVLSFYCANSNPDNYHEILSATSSNDNVVKVIQKPYITYNGGNAACTIQAVGAGSATITIKSNDSLGKTLVYKITVTGGSGSGSNSSGTGSEVKPATITVGKVVYKFVGNEMTVTKAIGNAKTYKIKSTISYAGKQYKVTKIGSNAFKGHAKLTKITIPYNVKTIGKKAFYGCKKLKTVTINSNNIKSVGASAFKKIKKNATIKVPKKKLKAYKKLFKGKTDKSTKVKK